MKHYLLALLLFSSTPLLAQDEETYSETYEEEETRKPTNEIGIDLNFSASNFGGTGGLGVKFGIPKGDKLILGPSIRYQQAWSNYNGVKTGFSIYGGGGFVHVRLANYFFVGMEIEVLSSPLQNGYVTVNRKWIPVALIGGGFSRAFGPNFRLNAGIMYDVVDNPNSPLRQGYFMHKQNGVLIPVIYRIAFFFPI